MKSFNVKISDNQDFDQTVRTVERYGAEVRNQYRTIRVISVYATDEAIRHIRAMPSVKVELNEGVTATSVAK